LGRAKAKKHFHKPPLFIGGCGRSGTTILLSILSAHPEVFACPKELGLFSSVKKDEQGKLVPTRIDRLYLAFLTNTIKKSATRFLEKSPNNVTKLPALDHYFKDYRFIHIIRDGRDVTLSKHPTQKNTYWVEPQRWVNDVSAGLEFANHPNVLTIFYEDLIQNYASTVSKITNHCQLPHSPEMQDWLSHTTVKRNRAYHGPVQQISSQSIGKWKAPKNQERVAQFMNYPGAADLLRKLGYVEGSPNLNAFTG
jgi:hypothetical protein